MIRARDNMFRNEYAGKERMDVKRWKLNARRTIGGIAAVALCGGVLLGFVRIWSAWAKTADGEVLLRQPEISLSEYIAAHPAPTAEPTIEPTVEPTVEPTAMPTSVPTQAPTAEPVAAERWVVASGDVNMRSGPGMNYSVLSVLSNGSVVRYLEQSSFDDRGVEWYSVENNGVSGWVSSRYSKLMQ